MRQELEIQKLVRRKYDKSIPLFEYWTDAVYRYLKKEYNIKANAYKGYVLFKYDLIIHGFNDLTKQTRGIILDSRQDWRVVNYPFEKFFNHTESLAPRIDWSSAKVLEKLDGSIIYVWYAGREEKWMISSSGTCNAFEAETGFGKSFGEVVSDAIKRQKLDFDSELHSNYCYMFELESFYNQIVVRQDDNPGKLTLLGIRSLDTYEEIDIFDEEKKKKAFLKNPSKYQNVQIHDFDSHYVFDFVKSRPPSESEGVVVVDKNFNRVKIKSDEYVLAHKVKSSIIASWRNVVEVVLSENLDDILQLLTNQEKSIVIDVMKKIVRWEEDFNDFSETLKGLDRKEVGIMLSKDKKLKNKFNAMVWNCHFGDKGTTEVIKEMNPKHIVEILELEK